MTNYQLSAANHDDSPLHSPCASPVAGVSRADEQSGGTTDLQVSGWWCSSSFLSKTGGMLRVAGIWWDFADQVCTKCALSPIPSAWLQPELSQYELWLLLFYLVLSRIVTVNYSVISHALLSLYLSLSSIASKRAIYDLLFSLSTTTMTWALGIRVIYFFAYINNVSAPTPLWLTMAYFMTASLLSLCSIRFLYTGHACHNLHKLSLVSLHKHGKSTWGI